MFQGILTSLFPSYGFSLSLFPGGSNFGVVLTIKPITSERNDSEDFIPKSAIAGSIPTSAKAKKFWTLVLDLTASSAPLSHRTEVLLVHALPFLRRGRPFTARCLTQSGSRPFSTRQDIHAAQKARIHQPSEEAAVGEKRGADTDRRVSTQIQG